ncbi:MAG: phytoene/squalene synthase family protein [Tepidisphaeraceae bacterium]
MTVGISDTPLSLSASHQYCRDLTRSAARNFYYGLKLLPEPKRSAMFVLYAYMRLVDDIADREDGRTIPQRIAELDVWREQTRQALEGHTPHDDSPVWPAFTQLATHYRVPAKVFDAVIAGQQQDLEPAPFETFTQLREYCYRVAGVVGLGSICIWGYEGGDETEEMAVALGVAFQLTNILRDLREDFSRDRCYLPLEDLKAFGIDPKNLVAGGEPFRRLMQFQIERAEAYYAQAAGLVQRVSHDSRPTLVAMTEIYHRLLRKVSRDPETVLHKRVSLSTWSKLKIGWRATWANRMGASHAEAT